MQIKFFLLPLLLLPWLSYSQSMADSSEYRQAKLGIWCETVRFIYTDNAADSLLNSLNCQNWDAFKQSIQANHLGAYDFFEAVEKPAIYAGYSTYRAKADKLIEEIGKKLKYSPSRRNDEQRLAAVDKLQQKLTAIAANPQSHELIAVPVQGQNLPEGRVAEPAEQQTPKAERLAEIGEAEEAGFPWLEIVQWLLLLLLGGALGWLYKKNKELHKELDLRMARRKQEISTLSIQKDKDPMAGLETAIPSGLQETEVLRLIRKELDRFRQQQQLKASRAASSQQGQKQQSQPKKEVKEEREALAQPLEQKEERPAEPGIYYDKLPFKGGFHQNHLSRQAHADSIYTIQVLKERPEEAAFWVTEDQEVQKYAMQNGLSFFEEACDYNQAEESPSRVRNLEKGVLRKKGHLWQIEKKVKVSFE